MKPFHFGQDGGASESDRALVRLLCSVDRGLSGWEADFVDRLGQEMREYEDRWFGLTDRQRAKCQEIEEKLVDAGIL